MNKEILRKSEKSYGEAVRGAENSDDEGPEPEKFAEPRLQEVEAHI